MPNETQHQDDNRTMAEQDEFAHTEAINSLDRTGEMPFLPAAPAAQPLPAYAPPLVAHHPEPKIKGRWWMVAAATFIGLAIAAGAWGNRSRVSSVGLLGVDRSALDQAAAVAPEPEDDVVTESQPAQEPEPLPDAEPEETLPDTRSGKLYDGTGDQGAESPDATAETDNGGSYSFSWPDEQGGQGYELSIPTDPESGDGTYSFSWPDEQGGDQGHEFSYRHGGNSYTFEYDGQQYSLDLEDLEWLLGEGGAGHEPNGGYEGNAYGAPGDLGYYDELQMPGFGEQYPADPMPGYEGWGRSW